MGLGAIWQHFAPVFPLFLFALLPKGRSSRRISWDEELRQCAFNILPQGGELFLYRRGNDFHATALKKENWKPFFLATYLLLLAQSLSWIKNFLELLFYCSSKRNDPFPLAGRTGHHPRLSLHIHTKNKRNALYKLQKRAKKVLAARYGRLHW